METERRAEAGRGARSTAGGKELMGLGGFTEALGTKQQEEMGRGRQPIKCVCG